MAGALVKADSVIIVEEINDDFPETDVVIVIDSNDIVDPAAQDDPNSPISGTTVLFLNLAFSNPTTYGDVLDFAMHVPKLGWSSMDLETIVTVRGEGAGGSTKRSSAPRQRDGKHTLKLAEKPRCKHRGLGHADADGA